MGVYYYYVNETKRQYFCIAPAEFNIKSHALGRNIGSRALSYLILHNDSHCLCDEPHPLVGSWIGDRFFATGDDDHTGFESITSDYQDIGQSIIEMLVAVAPYDLVKYGEPFYDGMDNGGGDWLIHLIEHDGDPIVINPQMRKRLSHTFRREHYLMPSAGLARVIAALKRQIME